MSQSQVLLGVLAVMMGVFVGLLLFVPAVAIAYRRGGRVPLSTVALWGAALLYCIGVWVYTLLPLPDPGDIVCAAPQLDPLAFAGDLQRAASGGHFVTDAAFLQLALNVLLFVPLGVFIRLIWRRGIVVSLVAGLLLSLLVETTQVTGVWGLYPCAYRVFDVDDLLTNTLGAAIGSVLSLLVPARLRVRRDRLAEALEPQPVTRVRRLVAALSDFLSVALTAFATLLVVVIVMALTAGVEAIDSQAGWVSGIVVAVPLLVSGGFFVVTGRTIGQAAVQLRYTGSPYPRAVAVALVFFGGIGGYQVLTAISALPAWVSGLFVLTSLAMVLWTKDARGLPGVLSRSHLIDSRTAPAPERERTVTGAR